MGNNMGIDIEVEDGDDNEREAAGAHKGIRGKRSGRIEKINRIDQAKEALAAIRELGRGSWIGREPLCGEGNRIAPEPIEDPLERMGWKAGQAIAATGKALAMGLVGLAAATVVGSMIISPLAGGLVGNASVATAAAYAMGEIAGEIARSAASIQRGLAFAQTGISALGAIVGAYVGAKSVMSQPPAEFRQEMLDGLKRRRERKAEEKKDSAERNLGKIRIVGKPAGKSAR